jgi:hypothetical protein
MADHNESVLAAGAIPRPMSREDAAGYIGSMFVFLREDLKHLAKGAYDADAHNLS